MAGNRTAWAAQARSIVIRPGENNDTRGNPEILLGVVLSSVSLRLRSERGWGSVGRTVYLKWEVCKPPPSRGRGCDCGAPSGDATGHWGWQSETATDTENKGG